MTKAKVATAFVGAAMIFSSCSTATGNGALIGTGGGALLGAIVGATQQLVQLSVQQ